MAIAKMSKLTLVGYTPERKSLLKKFQKLGFVQIEKTVDIENTVSKNIDSADVLLQKIARLEFAFNLLKNQRIKALKLAKLKMLQYEVPKKAMFALKPEISFEDFFASDTLEQEADVNLKLLESYNNQIVDLRSNEVKLISLKEQLKPYANFTQNFSFIKSTKSTTVGLGFVSSNKIEIVEQLAGAYENVFIESYPCGQATAVTFVCLPEMKEEILEKLAEADYSPCSFNFDCTAQQKIDECNQQLSEIELQKNKIVGDTMLLEKEIPTFQRLYDYYNIELQKTQAEENFKYTGSTYVLEAWLPETEKENIEEKLNSSKLALYFTIRGVMEGDNVPTLAVNNGVVTPYESVTNMFTAPAYGEIDPNCFVMMFFTLFFGVMVSDACYGLILTIITGVILMRQKPQKHQSPLIKILFMGGLSTFVWGIMFGGYFGMSSTDFSWIPAPVLFNPIEKPINMMALSLILGLIQMLFGLGVNIYAMFKNKKPLDAIGSFSWYFVIAGIVCVALAKNTAWVKTTGIVCLVLGFAMMMFGGALHKKGFKIVGGALGSLYGVVNFFSDLLSYTRLFGLGLATGVIAMVFNKIATVMFDLIPVVGYVIGAVILLVGHVFNIAINTLGAYVHNSRLQFVEFFGKFYTGGGKLFAPLGSNTKYYEVVKKVGGQND
ncbi:MAG: V-type ATP synthase subunit I [Clostridia bacterium]